MVQTPTKRHASASPEDSRPTKRALTSSPEEGELDDPMPLPTHDLPARPLSSNLPPKPKVPFTFQRRVSALENGQNAEVQEKVLPLVYERSEEDDRLFREESMKRRSGRPVQDEFRRRGQSSVVSDHWEPGMGFGRNVRSTPRDSIHYRGERSHPAYRDRLGKETRLDWSYSVSHSSSHEDHLRSQDPSPPSPNRSRSPSSHSSHYREVHRLPTTRTPDLAFTPPHRNYVDRIRDRDTRYDEYSQWPRDSHGHYPHASLEHGDRYWRPAYDANGSQGHQDDRVWTGDGMFDHDDRNRTLADRERVHQKPDTYRPSSPGLPPRPRSVTPRPKSIPSTPPPPSGSPPPPPPPEPRKDESLPATHAAVSIAIPLKRPGAPRGAHSPPSLPLPVAKEVNGKDPDGGKKPEAKKEWDPGAQVKLMMMARKRVPVKRSAKDEEKAYGRVFVGCGCQQDYEVTTKLGEGTFGEVHKAIHKPTGNIVALKRILMHNEKEGMPVTALREIKILKALNHPCIVELLDMFVVKSTAKDPLSVYMVFPYMDHDLAGLLDNERVKLQPSHIKLYMKQLLEGTDYMHRNHILHRDMKAANLLISNTGSLRIADFGLARTFDPNGPRGGRRYTNCVVTRWYRPPELLLGAQHYGGEVDIWGIGCVLGEMFSRRPILTGTSDLDQLEKIWQLCGTPNQHTWPNFDALPGCEGVKRFSTNHPRRIKTAYESVGAETCDLLDKLLICNPKERFTATQALDHDYFWTDPLPADPKTLPSYEASHEFDKRGRRPQPPPAGRPPPPRGNMPARPPPPPTLINPPLHFGRSGPPRDAFRTGPPAAPFAPSRPTHSHNHPPNPQYRLGQHPPREPFGARGHPLAGPPHRFGPPPPGQHRQDRRELEKNRPLHLPPRPLEPLGRGMGGHGHHNTGLNGDVNRGGEELNYG